MSTTSVTTTAPTENVSPSIIDRIINYYLDAIGEKPVPRNSSGGINVFFGDVLPGHQVGPLSLYIKNIHTYPIELLPKVNDQDLLILQYPQFLMPQQVGEVKIAFNCPIDRLTPLQAGFKFDLRIMNSNNANQSS